MSLVAGRHRKAEDRSGAFDSDNNISALKGPKISPALGLFCCIAFGDAIRFNYRSLC